MTVGNLLQVKLVDEDDFLKIRETLTRIGIASKKDNILYQSCHILHKRGNYYIVHFKELFKLDGKQSDFSENDEGRRNSIAKLLLEWGLIELVDEIGEIITPISQIKILPFKEKTSWTLVAKYNIGKK